MAWSAIMTWVVVMSVSKIKLLVAIPKLINLFTPQKVIPILRFFHVSPKMSLHPYVVITSTNKLIIMHLAYIHA